MKSFAQVVSQKNDINSNQLPTRSIKRDTICIKMNQLEYKLGIEESKSIFMDNVLLIDLSSLHYSVTFMQQNLLQIAPKTVSYRLATN